MRRSTFEILALALIVLIASSTFAMIPAYAGVIEYPPMPFQKYGPRMDKLIFKVAGDLATESDELEQGLIDMMDWAAPGDRVSAWDASADIVLGDYSEWGYYEFDLNNQMWPIGHGQMTPVGWSGTEPAVVTGHYWIDYSCPRCLDTRQLRRALAHLTDRDAISSFAMGFIAKMETYIFPGIISWLNPAAPKYPYNPTLAASLLHNAGFNDYDGDGKLEYSPSHAPTGSIPGDMEELPALQMWIRSDDPIRKFAGEKLRDELLLLEGGGFNIGNLPCVADRQTCYYHAWTVYDFHIYTGGWEAGREPDHYFDLFHSSKDIYPRGSADNYVRYHSQEFDPVAEDLKFATSLPGAKTACDQAQVIIARDVASIPLYTMAGYNARRANYHPNDARFPDEEDKYTNRPWQGFINELGYGYYGGAVGFSPLNVHPQGFEKGGVLRHGLLVDIEKFNPVHAEWFFDWLVLSKIYDELLPYHPGDASQYTSWLAESYTLGTWNPTPTTTATNITFKLLPNILWHDDVPFTAYDVAFTFQYMKDEVTRAWMSNVQYFDHAVVKDDLTVVIYFSEQSLWALTWAGGLAIIPKHIWEGVDSWTYDPEVEGTVIGTGPFRYSDHVQGEYVTLEANPTFFRKYVWPDACDATHIPDAVDNVVDLDDFLEVAKPGNIFKSENLDGTWPTPPGNWGEHCDVDKDGKIGISDLMEIGVHFGEAWPPPWY